MNLIALLDLDVAELDDAACATSGDPDLWHEPKKHPALREAAVKICNGCPARVACLEWAIDHNEHQGIWGGLLEEERAALRKAAS